MTFAETLEGYLSELDCTASALAHASGVSSATISRYRMGTRTPSKDSHSLDKLASGICDLSQAEGRAPLERETVRTALCAAANDTADDDATFANLDTLLSALDVRNTELARALNYDPSYLSRIRSGQRRPSDADAFLEGACDFAARRIIQNPDGASFAAALVGQGHFDEDVEQVRSQLLQWLRSTRDDQAQPASRFVEALSDFDLDEFIRAIRFDELETPPTIPVSIPREKRYQGVVGLRQGEIDFLRATLLSPKTNPVLIYSDMDMEDLAQDMDFSKKWMGGLAMLLKRGLHMDLIHDVNRPLPEMMLGLESWIPLYMTGQISPYYLPGATPSVFRHGLRTSGAAALSGEGVRGKREHDRYVFTTKGPEIAYLRQRGQDLLEAASPLMQIFRENSRAQFQGFLQAQAQLPGAVRRILSAPPLYTMEPQTLDELLAARNVGAGLAEAIRSYAASMRSIADAIQAHDLLFDEFPVLGEAEFAEHPVSLSLSGMFAGQDVPYTYEAYCAHVESTIAAAKSRRNYEVATDLASAFRNIQITVRPDKWAIVSKAKSPTIHFVIWHPKLVDALAHLDLPVFE